MVNPGTPIRGWTVVRAREIKEETRNPSAHPDVCAPAVFSEIFLRVGCRRLGCLVLDESETDTKTKGLQEKNKSGEWSEQ
jgi:hypothetical protein